VFISVARSAFIRVYSCASAKHWRGISRSYAQLFCRVPWRRITRSPWATRPIHLCRFPVRTRLNFSKLALRILEVFLGNALDQLMEVKTSTRCFPWVCD